MHSLSSTPTNSWSPVHVSKESGLAGPEEGIILRDEVHTGGAHIVLERDPRPAPFAITCSISGWMIHTMYFLTEETSQQAFEQLKIELARILRLIPAEAEPQLEDDMQRVEDAIIDFISQFS
ncbi:MAG: hypothetical protein H0X37_25500 [Herpetosiphonaceae bacterium]|nr:hypothetical protein [Herpetosiphonaceae bacterium]